MVSENAPSCPKCGNPMNGAQPSQNYNAAGVEPKDKTTAGLLALFLGGLGVHYFYLNKPMPGVVFLVVNLVGFFLFFLPCVVIGIICLVQGIMMLTMSEQDFNNKYVNTLNQFPLF